MFNNPLLAFFIITAFIGLLYSSLAMISANFYDVKFFLKAKKQAKHPYAEPYLYRPFVSILIPAHNEAAVIERCLSSLSKSTYRNLRIIVIDDGSTDDTAKIIRQFIKNHKNRDIKLISKRRNAGKSEALKTGLKRWARGELLMTLDADCVIDKSAIKKAVLYFGDLRVAALAPNVRILPSDKLLGLLQKFEYLLGFRYKKLHDAINCEYIIGGAGAIYRRKLFTQIVSGIKNMQTEDIAISLGIARLGNKDNRLVYASDVLVHTEPVPSYSGLIRQRYRWKFGALQAIYVNRRLLLNISRRYSKTLGWFRLPLALYNELLLIFEPLMFGFFLYMAVTNQNPALYLGASFTLVFILLINIWEDEHFSFWEKVQMTIFVPAMYPLFLLMTSVQIIAVFKCLRNWPAIAGKAQIDGRWVSPQRTASLAKAA